MSEDQKAGNTITIQKDLINSSDWGWGGRRGASQSEMGQPKLEDVCKVQRGRSQLLAKCSAKPVTLACISQDVSAHRVIKPSKTFFIHQWNIPFTGSLLLLICLVYPSQSMQSSITQGSWASSILSGHQCPYQQHNSKAPLSCQSQFTAQHYAGCHGRDNKTKKVYIQYCPQHG